MTVTEEAVQDSTDDSYEELQFTAHLWKSGKPDPVAMPNLFHRAARDFGQLHDALLYVVQWGRHLTSSHG